ncbi:FAD-dependent oxidoreductase [Halobacteria archaeon AArc-curdl1]|uniref:FAD-dependent oxidoreductase n=1 Tax=Natronosalvus hydrolyticus TaxID=2979988 RepID=A0AAP2ZAE1_9EURY|nr:FAD-dependent oxidoreductase [Halobacteria archaeon AArc-curdl1]
MCTPDLIVHDPSNPDARTGSDAYHQFVSRITDGATHVEMASDDVVEAVDLTSSHDLLVTVRGGGHNVAGAAVCNGGIVLLRDDLVAGRRLLGTTRVSHHRSTPNPEINRARSTPVYYLLVVVFPL